jgi:hypothetical protein
VGLPEEGQNMDYQEELKKLIDKNIKPVAGPVTKWPETPCRVSYKKRADAISMDFPNRIIKIRSIRLHLIPELVIS